MTVAEKREHDKQLSGLAWSIQFIQRSPAGTSNNQRKVELTYNDKTLANTAVREVGRIRLRNHNVNVSALIVYKKTYFGSTQSHIINTEVERTFTLKQCV